MKRRVALIAATAACVAALAGSQATLAAPTRAKTPEGVAYAMGAISVSELRELERRKDDYSLWITLAAKKTGAYLSDVQVRIMTADGKLVFNELVVGPWLFIDLPVGRYKVEAAFRGQPDTKTTQINKGDRHQMFFYFDSPADVSPEWHSPFKSNPYNDGKK